jgi:hypothetical protein
MDPQILMQINEIYRYEVYGDKELADINGWVSQLISEGYDLDDYSDEELYAAYLEDLDEANKSEKFLGLTPKERAEKRNQMANKNTKDRKWVHTSSRDISPKKRRADVEKEYTFNKKSWEKENPGKRFDNINDDDWDDDYDDRDYYKKNPMANVPRVPAPKPGRRKPLGANSIRPVQPFLQFSRAKSKRKQELDTQRQDAQRKEKEEMQKKSDNKWKTMMSIDDLKKRVNAPANKIVPLNREEIECIISYIINEGYADTFNSAELILFNMSEQWIESIMEDVIDEDESWRQRNFKPMEPYKQEIVQARHAELAGKTFSALDKLKKLNKKPLKRFRPGLKKRILSTAKSGKTAGRLATKAGESLIRQSHHDEKQKRNKISALKSIAGALEDNTPSNSIRKFTREELDLYNTVSDYLVSEGFCDSYEEADSIMVNISEQWIDGILDEVTGGGQVRFRKGLPGDKPKKRGMKEDPQRKAARQLGRLDVDPTADPQRRARLAKVALR